VPGSCQSEGAKLSESHCSACRGPWRSALYLWLSARSSTGKPIQSFEKVACPQPRALQGEPKMAIFMLYHHQSWLAAGEAKWRRERRGKKGWVAGSRCPVPSPGQRCGCLSQEESSLGSFSMPFSSKAWQLLFVTGLPVIKSLSTSKNCCRQLVVLGAEEIPWQGFARSWYLPVLEKAATSTTPFKNG